MIRISDIIAGIGAALSGSGYTVYAEQPRQLSAEERSGERRYIVPTVIPTAETSHGGRISDRTVMIDIVYAGTAEIANAEFDSFVYDMNRRLRPVFAFAGRHIMPERISTELVDGIGHYIFHLSFNDALDGYVPETAATMEGIKIKEEI